jgi:RHS repeat-associated protein
VLSANDYYAHGMTMPGRNFVSSQKYRYGYQNQEEDPELWNGAVNFKYRIEDPRLGRFFSVDPLSDKYPELTPYQIASNSPLWMSEVEGLEGIPYQYSDPLQPVWEGFGDIAAYTASWFDSWGFGNKEEVKYTIGKDQINSYTTKTSSTYVATTTETSTNFRQNLDYIKYHGSNKGNPNAMIKVKNETEVGHETEVKVTTTNKVTFTYSHKRSVDGVVTDEAKIDAPFKYRKLPLTIEGSAKNSDTKASIKLSVGTEKLGTSDHNTQFKAFAEGSRDKEKSTKTIKLGVSNSSTEGDATIKSDFYIKKDID